MEARAEGLVQVHALFQDGFVRRAPRAWRACSWRGQLSARERTAAVRPLQPFRRLGTWNDDPSLWRLEAWLAAALGEAEAAVSLDGRGWPNQGTPAVGVARQDGGPLGQLAHGQHAGFAASPSARGPTVLDRRRSRPEPWFDEAHPRWRRRDGVPDELKFTTAPPLGRAMVTGLLARGTIPCRGVLAEETDGAAPKGRAGVAVAGATRLWGGAAEVEAAGVAAGPKPSGGEGGGRGRVRLQTRDGLEHRRPAGRGGDPRAAASP